MSPIGPELLRRAAPDLPPAAARLLAECLETDPARRPSAAEAGRRVTALLKVGGWQPRGWSVGRSVGAC